MDSSDSRYGPAEVCFEHNIEALSAIKGRVFLYKLSDLDF
jgi:hypothetical protein